MKNVKNKKIAISDLDYYIIPATAFIELYSIIRKLKYSNKSNFNLFKDELLVWLDNISKYNKDIVYVIKKN